MNDPSNLQTSGDRGTVEGSLTLDTILSDTLPEIKLALGDAIDRENMRSMPARYAKLLPDSLLVVTLRADAADILSPISAEIERELTDSCMRHGSLYDRKYRVQLRRSDDEEVPLFRVSSVAGHGGGQSALDEELPATRSDRENALRVAAADAAASGTAGNLPSYDPDETRLDNVAVPGWQTDRWILLITGDEGEEREAFRLTEPLTTIGRRTDDPDLQTTVAISEAPHVSRRQLALVWEERDGAPGFGVYNLGLNPVHLPGRDLAGARTGRGSLDLAVVPEESKGWVPPGVPFRIGDRGPTLLIEELPEEAAEDDPDATVFE